MEELAQVNGFSQYQVSKEGKIFKITNKGLREIAPNMDRYGFLRVNLKVEGKKLPTTKRVHMIVYEAFNGKPNTEIVFLDNDRNNCNLNNLASIEDLVKCYKEHNGR